LLQPAPHTRRQVMEGLQEAFDLASIKGDRATMLSAANAMAALVGLAQFSRENGDPGASKPFAEMTDAELLEIMEGSQGR
jgi:hypothetical protein